MSIDRHLGNAIASASDQLRSMYEAATGALRDVADIVGGSVASAGDSPPRGESPAEGEVLIHCSSPATAVIRRGIDGRQHFIIHGPLHDREGATIGSFRGVYQAKIFSKSDLLTYPEPPAGPFDRPYVLGEAEWNPALNPTKSEWTFDRVGHVVTGVGVGLSRIAVQAGKGSTFWFATNSFLNGRTNAAQLALGEATSLATASFPTTPSLVDGMSFATRVSHVLSLRVLDQ
jgi:hypothetical protein